MKNISLLQQGFTICKMLLSIHHHLKDGHCQNASINEILQQKHINFLATSEPYYNIINIDEPSLQRCTLSSPRAKRAGPKGLRAESARAVTVQ